MSLWSMNSVCRFIEVNVYCVKFCVHAVASDSVPLSRRRVRLRPVCIDWTGHTMSYSLPLRSVEDHLLLDNVWRYLLVLFMDHPRHEFICRLSKSDIRSHDRLSLKPLFFWSRISEDLTPSLSVVSLDAKYTMTELNVSRYQTSDTSISSVDEYNLEAYQ